MNRNCYEWKMLWMENVMNTLLTEKHNEWKTFWNRKRYERKTVLWRKTSWTENVMNETLLSEKCNEWKTLWTENVLNGKHFYWSIGTECYKRNIINGTYMQKMLWTENVMNGKHYEQNIIIRKTLWMENVMNGKCYERKMFWTENIRNRKRY